MIILKRPIQARPDLTHCRTKRLPARRIIATAAVAAMVMIAGAACESTEEARLTIELINQKRADAGCPAVSSDQNLADAANRHAVDMRDNQVRGHDGSDGSTPQSRIADSGYTATATGEILYWSDQESNYQQAVAWWMDSPPHREIIENCTYTHIGVGVLYPGGSKYYSVAVFGAR